MASWVGPTVAISIAVIALCVVGLAAGILVVLREAREKSGALARELTELRSDLAPMLTSMSRLSEEGSEVIGEIRDELDQLLSTSRSVRRGVTKAVRQAQNRLADLDALVEVATEEAERAFLDAATAVNSVRSSAGLLRQVGRFLVPQAMADEEDEEYEEEEEEFEEEVEEETEDEEESDDHDEDVA